MDTVLDATAVRGAADAELQISGDSSTGSLAGRQVALATGEAPASLSQFAGSEYNAGVKYFTPLNERVVRYMPSSSLPFVAHVPLPPRDRPQGPGLEGAVRWLDALPRAQHLPTAFAPDVTDRTVLDTMLTDFEY